MTDNWQILADTVSAINDEMQMKVNEEMSKIDQVKDPEQKAFILKCQERMEKAKETQDVKELSQLIVDIKNKLLI